MDLLLNKIIIEWNYGILNTLKKSFSKNLEYSGCWNVLIVDSEWLPGNSPKTTGRTQPYSWYKYVVLNVGVIHELRHYNM